MPQSCETGAGGLLDPSKESRVVEKRGTGHGGPGNDQKHGS